MTDVTFRPQSDAEKAAAWELGRLAFGGSPGAAPTFDPAMHMHGAFDATGRLVATATDLEHGYWYGGRLVPGAGIGGVVVAPESRGSGLMRPLLGSLVAAARERGAVVSALFPSTSAPYRKLGWERVGAVSRTIVPTATLAGVRAPAGIALRPAGVADIPAVREIYRVTAQEGNGLLDRTGSLFTTEPEQLLAAFDGITVATGDGGAVGSVVEGYASWKRRESRLAVYDLIGRTAGATQALLAMLGSWRSVVPSVALRLPAEDPVLMLAGTESATEHRREPWMLRLIDAPAAVAARGFAPHVTGAVDLRLTDDLCPWNGGSYRLELDGGTGRLVPGGSGAVAMPPRGIAAWYAGIAPAVLRRTDLLSGGDATTDALLAAATAGPKAALLDSF